MHLSQIKNNDQYNIVARTGETANIINNVATIYELALHCANNAISITDRIQQLGLGEAVNLAQLSANNQLIAPLQHPDPAHLHLTGTGLTHLSSASTRDDMHVDDATKQTLTDSKKMFLMGVEGGKQANNAVGAQPEWFYKGNGHAVANPNQPLVSPSFAKDGGEEPELAGLYIISDNGSPFRVGFALANEFSDHVTEKVNYLFLAHSKLRPASYGPEILVGTLPQSIEGTSRIIRNGKTIFNEPFLTGEANMSHYINNLEHHHFKYDIFRQAGDVHIHMFGTATLSFAKNIQTQHGDIFEISAPDFGLPLCNPHHITPAANNQKLMKIQTL